MRTQLFCLPYAGGSARMYQSWRPSLALVADVWPVELAGRGSRITERPHELLPPLLDDAVDAVRPHLDKPIVLFGHSLGALLAFEMARLLSDRYGRPPCRLIVSGHRAPHLPMREAKIHHLPDEEFVSHLRTLNGTPEEVLGNSDVMRLLLPALRADFAVSESYRYVSSVPLPCPVTVFGGVGDPDTPLPDLSAWARHASGRCRVQLFPGDHFFLHTAEALVIRALGHDLPLNGAALKGRPATRSTVRGGQGSATSGTPG